MGSPTKTVIMYSCEQINNQYMYIKDWQFNHFFIWFCTCMLFNHNVIYTYTIYVLMYSEYQGKCLETGTFRYKLINKYSHLPMYLSVVTFCIVYYIYTYIFINTYSIYTSMMSQRRWLNMVGGQGDQIRRTFWYRFDHVRPYLIGSSS